MRYIKKLALYTKSPMDDKWSVLQDSRVVTNSSSTMQMPTGTRSQRPTVLTDGTIRYNSEIGEFEVYNSQHPNSPNFTPWEILRTIRQATITPQNLGYGNYNDTIFGPLSYSVDITKPQNVLVFVDNVYQVPTTNYTLINDPAASTALTSRSISSNSSTIYLNTLSNIDVGEPGVWRNISAPSGIPAGTTITSISTVFSNPNNGYAVVISNPTTGIISSGTTITVGYSNGTYVQFTGPVPAKPVFSLLGFDGYYPAGKTNTIFEP